MDFKVTTHNTLPMPEANKSSAARALKEIIKTINTASDEQFEQMLTDAGIDDCPTLREVLKHFIPLEEDSAPPTAPISFGSIHIGTVNVYVTAGTGRVQIDETTEFTETD